MGVDVDTDGRADEEVPGCVRSRAFLLRVERIGTPSTLNHYFNGNLKKRYVTFPIQSEVSYSYISRYSRRERVSADLTEKAIKDFTLGVVVKLDQILQTRAMSNVEHFIA